MNVDVTFNVVLPSTWLGRLGSVEEDLTVLQP